MPHDLKALCHQWFDEVWTQGNAETIDLLMHPEACANGMGEEGQRGTEGFKALQALYRGAFPDLTVSVEQVLQDGEFTACRIRCRGTHLGDQLGIPPTGRTVEFQGMTMAHWRDGKMTEGWNTIDFAAMQAQLAAE